MPKLLLAEDDDAVRNMLRTALLRDGFDVVAVASVREALGCIAQEQFDVLLSDLHMPHAGDGFTVISAMRHTHPAAVTLVLSGYPELDEALSAIRLQADEVLVKPMDIASLREIIHKKLANPTRQRPLPTESVASILEHDRDSTIQHWMELVEQDEELTCIALDFRDRTGHLPNLLADLIYRLRLPANSQASISVAAGHHGKLRRQQGYTAAMIVEESRILQVSIFNTLKNNLSRVDFSKVLLDVITIADEVDSQLKQAILTFVKPPEREEMNLKVKGLEIAVKPYVRLPGAVEDTTRNHSLGETKKAQIGVEGADHLYRELRTFGVRSQKT
jgi:DNA-binding response OmpR family regulator